MNILVTGGAGFVGTNLIKRLLSDGNNVISLDNYSTGFKSNILDFFNNPRFTFIEGDIRNFKTCLKITQNIDFVHINTHRAFYSIDMLQLNLLHQIL